MVGCCQSGRGFRLSGAVGSEYNSLVASTHDAPRGLGGSGRPDPPDLPQLPGMRSSRSRPVYGCTSPRPANRMPLRSCSCTGSRSTGGSGARSSLRSLSATACSRRTSAAPAGRMRRLTGTPWRRFSPMCSRCWTSSASAGSTSSHTTQCCCRVQALFRPPGTGRGLLVPRPAPYLRFKPQMLAGIPQLWFQPVVATPRLGAGALGTDRLAHHLLRGGTATAESITPARDARRIRQPGGRPHRPRHRRRGTFPRRRPARRGRDSRAGIVRARPLTDASSRAARWAQPGDCGQRLSSICTCRESRASPKPSRRTNDIRERSNFHGSSSERGQGTLSGVGAGSRP